MLQSHFGKKLVVMKVTGCANLICLQENLPSNLQLEEANDYDPISDVVKIIAGEIKTNEKKNTYNLENFTYDEAVADTSKTLLQLISRLVSFGTVTKQFISIAQSIQAEMSKSFNQTTLGLAVKLHHMYGSRDLIDILNSCGFISSYDEVLRFRKSAAKMTAETTQPYEHILNADGLISTWFDNFDLQVFTPNGNRETHCMAVEFTQHAQGNC